MSCEKCEEAAKSGLVAWFRWKHANVGLIGCREHLIEVMEVLRAAQK